MIVTVEIGKCFITLWSLLIEAEEFYSILSENGLSLNQKWSELAWLIQIILDAQRFINKELNIIIKRSIWNKKYKTQSLIAIYRIHLINLERIS